eukprot:161759_1
MPLEAPRDRFEIEGTFWSHARIAQEARPGVVSQIGKGGGPLRADDRQGRVADGKDLGVHLLEECYETLPRLANELVDQGSRDPAACLLHPSQNVFVNHRIILRCLLFCDSLVHDPLHVVVSKGLHAGQGLIHLLDVPKGQPRAGQGH